MLTQGVHCPAASTPGLFFGEDQALQATLCCCDSWVRPHGHAAMHPAGVSKAFDTMAYQLARGTVADKTSERLLPD